MSVNNEQQICPKHRVVMKNGTCRMCQAEYYNENYRMYGKNDEKGKSTKNHLKEKKKKAWNNTNKEHKKGKKAVAKHINRPATDAELQKLLEKFNSKK